MITEVKLKVSNPPPAEIVEIENLGGLAVAVVYTRTNKVIALFGCSYWAGKFLDSLSVGDEFTIREVAE